MMDATTSAAIVEHMLAVSDGKTITLTREAAEVLARGYRVRDDRATEAERVLLAISGALTPPGKPAARELPMRLSELILPTIGLCREAWEAREKKP